MKHKILEPLFLTIVGLIAWQIVASAFLKAFMANPLTCILLRITLLIDMTGICNGAWVLAAIHGKLAGFQRDEVYIGTAEERTAKQMTDGYTQLQVGAEHMTKLPVYVQNAPNA